MKDKIIEYLTIQQTKKFWGECLTGSDCLIEEVHGDGKQLVYLETMDSRPFHYIIRVDSSLDLTKEDHEILPENYDCHFGEMLIKMIVEEHDDIDRYQEIESGIYTSEQDKKDGIKPFKYKFPMFSLGGGYSYGLLNQKNLIIGCLQQLDLTQFVPYDSDNNFPIDKNTGCCSSSSFSYQEMEFGDYNIILEISADYKVDRDGDYELISLKCEGDVINSDGDVVMSEQEIQPHLNTI